MERFVLPTGARRYCLTDPDVLPVRVAGGCFVVRLCAIQGLLASLAASNVKELGLLVVHANMSRNSRHSKYGFEINANIKIPSSQFSVFDIRQRRFKHRSIAHRLLSCSGRPLPIKAHFHYRCTCRCMSRDSRYHFTALRSASTQCNAQP